MASVGSLTVEIAADIAKLRSGVEETQSRLAGLERTTAKTGQNMQRSFEQSVAGINAAWIKMGVVAATAMKAWDFAEQAAGFQEQKQMLAGLAENYKTSADNIINSMSEASDGLIAKTDLMNVALAGMAKGMNPKQLTDLAAAADTLGDSVGKGATEAFQDLTEAITKGTEKQLKAYLGAQDLERVMAQLPKDANEYEKAQARLNAVLEHAAKIQKTMGDESESTADKMDRFKAQVADLKLELGEGLVSAGLAVVSVFQGITAGMFKIIEAKNRIMGMAGGINEAGRNQYKAQAQAAAAEAAELWNSMKSNWKLAFSEIKQTSAAASKAAADVDYAGVADVEANRKALLQAEREYEKEQKLIYDQLLKDAEEQANAMRQIKEISAEDNRKIDEMEMERAEAWAEQRIQVYQDMVERISELNQQISSAQSGMDRGVISKGLEGTNIASPLMGLMDSMNGEDAYQAQIDRIEEQYATQLELLQEYQDTYFSMEEGFVTQREQMERLAASRQLAIDRLNKQQRVSIAQNTFGTLAGVAQAFYAASDNQNKAALNAYKAFAIAETLIATYSSAQKLFDFGAKFGPWTAAAFAAIGIAAGMARVHQIATNQPGTSSVSAGAGSGISAGEGGASAATETTTTTTTAVTEPATSQVVNIYIQGNVVDQDKFAREVLPAIRKAMGDGA